MADLTFAYVAFATVNGETREIAISEPSYQMNREATLDACKADLAWRLKHINTMGSAAAWLRATDTHEFRRVAY